MGVAQLRELFQCADIRPSYSSNQQLQVRQAHASLACGYPFEQRRNLVGTRTFDMAKWGISAEQSGILADYFGFGFSKSMMAAMVRDFELVSAIRVKFSDISQLLVVAMAAMSEPIGEYFYFDAIFKDGENLININVYDDFIFISYNNVAEFLREITKAGNLGKSAKKSATNCEHGGY